MSPCRPVRLLLVVSFLFAAGPGQANEANFESPSVHPIELSPGGDFLHVAHLACQPDGSRLPGSNHHQL